MEDSGMCRESSGSRHLSPQLPSPRPSEVAQSQCLQWVRTTQKQGNPKHVDALPARDTGEANNKEVRPAMCSCNNGGLLAVQGEQSKKSSESPANHSPRPSEVAQSKCLQCVKTTKKQGNTKHVDALPARDTEQARYKEVAATMEDC